DLIYSWTNYLVFLAVYTINELILSSPELFSLSGFHTHRNWKYNGMENPNFSIQLYIFRLQDSLVPS
ncbi:hypothetical protein, partial [Pseudomonas poae]|uniref:hypothetical protein n=1 Tax=Pseudomonas poae TaxID=200451 RepID=UPI0034D44224